MILRKPADARYVKCLVFAPAGAGKTVFICDVEQEGAPAGLAAEIGAAGHTVLHGVVHSIAFANYSEEFKPFHETKRADFLQAMAVSAFSLVEIARSLPERQVPPRQ